MLFDNTLFHKNAEHFIELLRDIRINISVRCVHFKKKCWPIGHFKKYCCFEKKFEVKMFPLNFFFGKSFESSAAAADVDGK